MLKEQIDQYDMLLTVEKHFNDNIGIFTAGSPILATKTLFSSKITALAAQIAIQLINPTGLTEDKNNARAALENQAFILGAACCSYASANNKPDLYNRCDYTITDLRRFRDAELIGICTNLLADATANAAALVPFKVIPATLTNFQAAITAFSNVMKTPTEGIAKRTVATAKIAELLPQILELVEERLDKDVIAYTTTNPAFVEVYNTVRLINSSPTSTLSLTITVLEAVNHTPIPNVQLEIIGEGITRKTSERGYSTIINLVSGTHTIKTNHPNYQPLEQSFTVVSGETTELVLLLTAM
ncbi:MAG: hypothetical protein U0U67_09240 [Chitinophagales bacterium]